MTSLAQPPALPSFELARRHCGTSKSRYRETLIQDRLRASQGIRQPGGIDFREGLPTPPSSQAMTGISAQSTRPSHFGGQAFYEPIRNSHHDTRHNTAGWAQNPGIVNEFLDGAGADEATRNGSESNREIKRDSNQSIASFLRIPEAIDPNGGSLTELAAEVTCLFWFESASLLYQLEQTTSETEISKPVVADAVPTMGFRKWVTTILATTQVTQNVIVLALLFIYRLKNINPQVSGKQGSEFRLLTIALMLGNKFLDDNTYTNKTWAEVSGISVSEIHIMEVEFLSNMRYNLFVSEREWQVWQTKLRKFRAFLKAASKFSASLSSVGKLPSPPSPLHDGIPDYVPQGSWVNGVSAPRSRRASPTRMFPDPVLGSRKRSLERLGEEPPAKRQVYSTTPSTLTPTTVTAHRLPTIYPPTTSMPLTSLPERGSVPQQQPLMQPSRVPRLPMPRIHTGLDMGTPGGGVWNNQLPLPNSRQIPTTYPNPSAWTQPSLPTTPVTSSVPTSLTTYATSLAPLADTTVTGLSYPRSVHTSPINPSYSALTPTSRLSPSVFLTNRNSPYRPIRSVNTLLYPPPSTSLQNSSRRVEFDQMHYQPLSKNLTERKSGVVPFMHQDPWSHPYTLHPTPSTQPGYQ